MYALFAQSHGFMTWLSNHLTLEEAKSAMDSQTNDMADFLMILPVVAFRDLDGERTE